MVRNRSESVWLGGLHLEMLDDDEFEASLGYAIRLYLNKTRQSHRIGFE